MTHFALRRAEIQGREKKNAALFKSGAISLIGVDLN
jgi:hypothetical protein